MQLKEITGSGDPAFDLKPGSPPEIGFAPSPDGHHRSVSFVESEQNDCGVQRTTHFLSSNGGDNMSVDGQTSYGGTLERKAEAKRLQRVDEMRKRFEQKSLVPSETDSATVQTTSSHFVSTQGIPSIQSI